MRQASSSEAFRLASPDLVYEGEVGKIVVGDLDGDGDDDFIAHTNEADWVFRRDSEKYSGEKLGHRSNSGLLVDVNGDGYLDYVFAPKEEPGRLLVSFGGGEEGIQSKSVTLIDQEMVGFEPDSWRLFEGGREFSLLASSGKHLVALGNESRSQPLIQNLEREVLYAAELDFGGQARLLTLSGSVTSIGENEFSVYSFVEGKLFLLRVHDVPGALRFVVMERTGGASPLLLFGTAEGYRSGILHENGDIEWRSEEESNVAQGIGLVPGRSDLAISYGHVGMLEVVSATENSIRILARYFVGRSFWVQAIKASDSEIDLIAQADDGKLLRYPVRFRADGMVIPAPLVLSIGNERAYDVAVADINGDGNGEVVAAFPIEGAVVVFDSGSGRVLQKVAVKGAKFLAVLHGQPGAVRVGVAGDDFAIFGPSSSGELELLDSFDLAGEPYRIIPLMHDGKRGFVVPMPAFGRFDSFLEGADGSFRAVAGVEYQDIEPATSASVDFDCDGVLDLVSVDHASSKVHAFRGRGNGKYEHIGGVPTADGPLAIEAWSADQGAVVIVGGLATRELRSYVLSAKGDWTEVESIQVKFSGLPYKVIPRMIKRVDSCNAKGSWLLIGDGGQVHQGRIDGGARLTMERSYPAMGLVEVFVFGLSDVDGDGVDDVFMTEGNQLVPRIGIWSGECWEDAQ